MITLLMKKNILKKIILVLFVLPALILISLFITQSSIFAQTDNPSQNHIPVCPGPIQPGTARCHAQIVTDQRGAPQVTNSPYGYGPAQFLGAYGLTGISTSSSTPIIAIVDAYDDPYVKTDLDKYSNYFGIPTLPTCAGSIQNSTVPCFQKVNQNGTTAYPQANSGWALEISLDVQVAHAICQNCKLLLVEANSSSYSDLMSAVDRAYILGANVISNSYGSNEFSGETSFDYHFNHPGVAITFSSGDSGYGPTYPAASQYVTAVGGTRLSVNPDNSYAGETAWNGAGSGCSQFEAKPTWQTDSNCANRTIADISADADPNTGAAIYDSFRYQGHKGWFKVGGTSLAAPLIAAVYALASDLNSTSLGNQLPYANAASLHDVTSGSNGSCGGIYLCTALPSYDGPTGLGTPNGIVGF